MGEVNISPGFLSQPLCLWVEIMAMWVWDIRHLPGISACPSHIHSVCSAHPYSAFAAVWQAQDIHVRCIFFFFFAGNPVRILQSGNNKICMIHQCSPNALAFAALQLTSCSLSILARNSLRHGVCPWVLNIWRMLWRAQLVCMSWSSHGSMKLAGLSEEGKVI